MTNELLKQEEISLTADVWTFEPEKLELTPNDDGTFDFPADIEELFYGEGFDIYADLVDVFEKADIDGKDAYISTGQKLVAVLSDLHAPEEDTEIILPGAKVGFLQQGLMVLNECDSFFVLPVN